MSLVDGNHPADTDAIVEIVETLVLVVVAHDVRLAVFVVKHAEVVVAERFGVGIGDFEGDGEVVDSGVAHDQIADFAVKGDTTTHAVVAVLIIINELIRSVLRLNHVVDPDAVAQVADAGLHKKATIGVGLKGEQLADFSLEMEAPLKERKGGGNTAATDHFAVYSGDALSQKVYPRPFYFVAENEIAIGGEKPVTLILVNDTPADGVGESKIGPGIHPRKLGGVSYLKHGDRNGFFVKVAWGLGDDGNHRCHNKKQKKDRFSHGTDFVTGKINVFRNNLLPLRRFLFHLMETEQYNIATLSNGIRLFHRRKKGEIAHLVLVVGTGSRDELESQNGMAHFIEHTIFKGTQTRKPYHILSCLDNVGGDLNAFTTKEETCLQASFLKAYYQRALDLLSDIAFQATFPENELEKEKEVVLDEINSYLDMPSEEIYDVFEDVLFKNHPLGRNILGTNELVRNFNRDDILEFRNANYSTDNMILATIGDISFEDFQKMAMRFFGYRPAHLVPNRRQPFQSYVPRIVEMERRSHLSHCMIGGLAPEFGHPKKRTMVLLNNILGGPAMNSRLSLNIREKYGFAYTIESQYNAYSDTGLFSVYMGVDPDSLDKAIGLVYKELNKLCTVKLGTMQLHHAKQQLIGQLALGRESGMSELLAITRSMLMNEPIESIPEIIQTIEVITADDLMAEANEVFDRHRLTTLVFRGSK